MKTKLFLLLSMFLFSWVYAVDLSLCQQKQFLITWYYSPKPWQSFYSRGTYELEVRLNGNGTHWASWVPVYNGMVAWPKSYTFGKIIYLPSFGVGKIHDRWGAIVKAGEKWQSYDRLDIWMGEWEEWLFRALNFGKRKIVWYVCEDIELNIWFDFENINLWKPNNTYSSTKMMFTKAFKVWEVHKEVKTLQEWLTKLWYYTWKINSTYDTPTITALYQFQLKNNIVKSTDIDVGYFGDKTREKLTIAIKQYDAQQLKQKQAEEKLKKQEQQAKIPNECTEVQLFPKAFEKWEKSENISLLQQKLNNLGYKCEKTWVYDASTIVAVYNFQLDKKLLPKWDKLWWYFGDKTREKFTIAIKQYEETKVKQENQILFPKAFEKQEKGQNIALLQQYLNALGYKCEKTSVYDSATIQAVYQFQLDKKLLPKWDKLWWYFGGKTREKFTLAISWINLKLAKQDLVQSTWSLLLKKWDTSLEILIIKNNLAKLWYYLWEANNNYDSALFTWVVKFQIEKNLLPANDPSLGVIGSKTKEKIMEYVKIYDQQQYKKLAELRKEELKKPFVKAFKTSEMGEEIKRLQECLKTLWYYDEEINGVYNDKTAWAVYEFQLDNKLIWSDDTKAKWNLWPKTRDLLNQKILEKIN